MMLNGCSQKRESAKFRKTNGLTVWYSVLLLIFIVSLFGKAAAQNYTLQIHSIDNNRSLIDDLAKPASSYASSEEILSFIRNIVPVFQEKGYLSASIDSLTINEYSYELYFFVGKQYKWANIDFGFIPTGVLTQAAIKKEQWTGRPLNTRQVAFVSELLLKWAEDNGYPFATVHLDAMRIDSEGRVDGSFVLEKGALQVIDTIDIHGNVKVSRNYLLNYLGIKQKEVYNEKKLRSISQRLRELRFLQEASPWTFEFKLSDNKLNLYLKEKKANQLNALIGLLPNSVETGKLLLTVDALFSFQNILSHGESINLSYQNLQYKSPRLKADLIYPYLLNTRFGLEGHFDLFKKDTTFRRTSLQAGLRYQLSATDYVRFFYHNQSNRLITVDTTFVKLNQRLPDNIDVSANGGGLEIGINTTDYRVNPRKGFDVRLTSSALIRKVNKSDAITELKDASGFDYNTLYDTLIKRQYQYFINGAVAYYAPLGKKTVFKSAYSGGWVSGANLFRNELYQIGGFRLLRGFDEQSIFTDQYHVIALELRLLLDQNSYFYLFSDNGYVESNFNETRNSDIYNGFGIGATLETKSGLFTISYALGRNSVSQVQFRQSKVHFGYVAYF